MPDRVPLPQLYAGARERLTEFVLARPGDWAVPVPATPGWRVHDVVAHLAGVAQDLAGGWSPTGGPTEEWTAGHVARGRDVPVPALVDMWAQAAHAVERILAERTVWPVVMDVGAHELDVRNAVGDRGGRDTDVVTVGAAVLLKGLQVPRPLVVRTERTEVRVGPEGEGEPVVLTTTTYEAFRWRLGRRSRAQLAAMDWSADPTPFLDHLCVFGPATADVVE